MHVCVKRTDGRTDIILIARPLLHSMQRGKIYPKTQCHNKTLSNVAATCMFSANGLVTVASAVGRLPSYCQWLLVFMRQVCCRLHNVINNGLAPCSARPTLLPGVFGHGLMRASYTCINLAVSQRLNRQAYL